MSTKINDGGPAFPVSSERNANGEILWGFNGMSLRDWFAGQALAGELSAQNDSTGIWTERLFEKLAERSYKIADAMLKAREAKP